MSAALLFLKPRSINSKRNCLLCVNLYSQADVLRVRFFRVSVGGSVELGSVSDEPFVLSTVMPADARDEVDFFVKVTDNGGQTRDRDRVGVEVTTP